MGWFVLLVLKITVRESSGRVSPERAVSSPCVTPELGRASQLGCIHQKHQQESSRESNRVGNAEDSIFHIYHR